jgi:hypothetical protein
MKLVINISDESPLLSAKEMREQQAKKLEDSSEIFSRFKDRFKKTMENQILTDHTDIEFLLNKEELEIKHLIFDKLTSLGYELSFLSWNSPDMLHISWKN